jgi:hypothetical protein
VITYFGVKKKRGNERREKKKTGKKEIYAVCEHFLNTSFGIKQKIFAFKKNW